ncbi:NAD-dependent epimerase [Pontibacter sp. HSC-36F09]|uniref:NAD-dependent epimerase n=1 Tax=Pontibacter sp. HSC-36F09 TaxID=2910966 RepID=UPI0020A1A8DC|nr:NAD-dependent epimerase [Pontibacter sp. HSC-36F09]MCP2043668.1 UDP-glucuronate 4-epimerase [Pontibacter sp. HSC-36F09]
MKVLVTGSAGFIGFHLVNRLLERGDEVVGYDNINDYYEVRLKYGRLEEAGIAKEKIEVGSLIQSSKFKNYRFVKEDVVNKEYLHSLFKSEKFDAVINLAAQAGVRYSLENPDEYISSNVQGFLNVLEACRHYPVKHLVYASSSSVYGTNTKVPFSTNDQIDHPISLYAASKKSNELMAHTYSHLFNIPTTGIRFFTVYGPWGRPDMALFLFTKKIIEREAIQVFNNGEMKRDFTYIDDIIEGVQRVVDKPAKADGYNNVSSKEKGLDSKAPYRIYNIGNSSPVLLTDFIDALEESIGIKAKKEYLPLQPGDVLITWADVDDLIKDFEYQPNTELRQGINNFVKWYKWFYNIA